MKNATLCDKRAPFWLPSPSLPNPNFGLILTRNRKIPTENCNEAIFLISHSKQPPHPFLHSQIARILTQTEQYLNSQKLIRFPIYRIMYTGNGSLHLTRIGFPFSLIDHDPGKNNSPSTRQKQITRIFSVFKKTPESVNCFPKVI